MYGCSPGHSKDPEHDAEEDLHWAVADKEPIPLATALPDHVLKPRPWKWEDSAFNAKAQEGYYPTEARKEALSNASLHRGTHTPSDSWDFNLVGHLEDRRRFLQQQSAHENSILKPGPPSYQHPFVEDAPETPARSTPMHTPSSRQSNFWPSNENQPISSNKKEMDSSQRTRLQDELLASSPLSARRAKTSLDPDTSSKSIWGPENESRWSSEPGWGGVSSIRYLSLIFPWLDFKCLGHCFGQ